MVRPRKAHPKREVMGASGSDPYAESLLVASPKGKHVSQHGAVENILTSVTLYDNIRRLQVFKVAKRWGDMVEKKPSESIECKVKSVIIIIIHQVEHGWLRGIAHVLLRLSFYDVILGLLATGSDHPELPEPGKRCRDQCRSYE